MNRRIFSFLTLIIVAMMLLTACAPAATPTPQTIIQTVEVPKEVQVTKEVVVTKEVEVTKVVERIPIRWYVGIGTGGNAEQIEAQHKVVEEFNATHDNIELILEIVPKDVAKDTLKTQIASGTGPDIVGPMGVAGANGFLGAWLDLTPYIEKYDFDMSRFDLTMNQFWFHEGEGQVAIPFGVFPSFIYYNRDLFDEAGLPYPPHKYGEDYQGKPWDVEALTELAMKLTVDKNGNDATSPDFDPNNIVQFGFEPQWTDLQGTATLFGADRYWNTKDNTVNVPENWVAAWKWFYDGIWDKHFIPNAAYVNSDLLANGNPFSSGNIAMVTAHTWYLCCVGDTVKNWDAATTPSHNGTVTNRLQADTFRILKSSKHPDEAFQVLMYLLTDAGPELLQVYGGMPADKSQQEAWIAQMDEKYSQGVDWQVMIDSLSNPDIPNHEADMPNYLKSYERANTFFNLMQSTPGLNLDAEIKKFRTELQAIWDEVK